MELIGTAGVVGATARRAARAVDGGEHSYFVDGAPGAAVRAAADPFRGDVVALRTAVLRTRLGHDVTVSATADRSLVVTARVAARFVGRVAAWSRRGASPAEIGTGTVVWPAFSKVKVKS